MIYALYTSFQNNWASEPVNHLASVVNQTKITQRKPDKAAIGQRRWRPCSRQQHPPAGDQGREQTISAVSDRQLTTQRPNDLTTFRVHQHHHQQPRRPGLVMTVHVRCRLPSYLHQAPRLRRICRARLAPPPRSAAVGAGPMREISWKGEYRPEAGDTVPGVSRERLGCRVSLAVAQLLSTHSSLDTYENDFCTVDIFTSPVSSSKSNWC